MDQRVALVTGASRGIGKSVAVHLARAGFDLAIGARTLQEGEARRNHLEGVVVDGRVIPYQPLPSRTARGEDSPRPAGPAAGAG